MSGFGSFAARGFLAGFASSVVVAVTAALVVFLRRGFAAGASAPIAGPSVIACAFRGLRVVRATLAGFVGGGAAATATSAG